MEGNNMQNHIALQLETQNAMDAVENGFKNGKSRLEMLAPEIRMHTLSFLDSSSLCNLSMTNSFMNKDANNETVWKKLYYKDYTPELRNIKPERGWKKYYEITRAVLKTNTEFFKTLKEKSLVAMSNLWLDKDHVRHVLATCESFNGYYEVMESWKLEFSRENVADFQIQIVRTHVHACVALITMKAHVGTEIAPWDITNIYELINGRWYIVLHHRT